MKRIALGWVDYHTRTASLSRALDLKPYFIWRLGRVRRWLLPIKYLWQAMDTVGILIRERPDVILVQTPPIFVALIACLYAVGRRCQVILDAHSATFLSPKWRWSMSLHRWCSRHAQITLVHAPTLAPLLEEWSVPTMTLGHCAIDPGLCEPPGGGGERGDGIRTAARPAASRAISESSPVEGDFTLAVPCSFNEDEPIDSILDAAAQLPGVRFLITGNDRRLPPQLAARRPGNVTFTGFLPLPAYFELLRSVDAVLVLTTDPDTIQHGGVEAVWLERPVITSGSLALRQVFHQGTVFVDNTPAGIRAGVLSARQNLEQLKAGVAVLRREFERDWQAKCSYLRVITGGGLPASPPSGLEVVDCAPGVEHRP